MSGRTARTVLLNECSRIYVLPSFDKSTVHRVVHCMQSAKLSRRTSNRAFIVLYYPFSKYMKFVADVDLAASLLHIRHKSRGEIRKNEA